MARKARRPARRWRPGPGKTLLCLAAAAALAFGNWFAHLPTAERAAFGPAELTLEALGAITADLTDALGLTGRDVAVPYAKTPAPGPAPFGLPRVADPSVAPGDVRVLRRQGYWVGFSPSLHRPVWAAYAVPERRLLESAPPRPPFAKDAEAPGSPEPGDYTGSGYDRGHLAPNHAIATRYGKAAQAETFLMTNIAPQAPELNRGPWRALEQIVAEELPAAGGGTVWAIVCLAPGAPGDVLRKGGVQVPKGFGMVLAAVRGGALRAIALYMPQETKETKRPRYCFRSVRELERLTGLDFFPDLPKAAQEALETREASRFWPTLPLLGGGAR